MGLVTFNGTTAVAVPPSLDRAAVLAGIDGMALGEGTAISNTVATSVEAVATVPGGEDGERPRPASW